MKKKTKVILVIITIAIIICIINFRKDPAEGLFLLRGTSGLVKIKRTLGCFHSGFDSTEDENTKLDNIHYKNGELILVYKFRNYNFTIFTAYFLLPSKATPGDWDLTGISYAFSSFGDDFDDLLREGNIKNLDSLQPSFLHRVDNHPWMIEYYKKLRNKKAPMSDIELVTENLKANPDDPYVAEIFMDALAFHEEWELLEREVLSAEKLIAESPNPFLKEDYQRLKTSLKARDASLKNINAFDYYLMLENIGVSEYDYIDILEKMADCDDFIPFYNQKEGKRFEVPLFLTCQIISKVTRVNAEFEMMKGNKKLALHYLTLDYRLSQHIGQSGSLIGLLIGVAVKSITSGGMHLYLENSCVTPEDVEMFYVTMKDLRNRDVQIRKSPEDIIKKYTFTSSTNKESAEELIIRWKVTEARVRALQAGAGARHYFLTEGRFPKTTDEFDLLQSDGFPKDPFDEKPLRFLEKDDVFIIYSIGPDEKDNNTQIIYDPTNGKISPGDVSLEFRKERKYLFPEKGKLATTKDGLEAQFPNGLPFDSFHNEKGSSYTIIDETPAKIISFGPDTDSIRLREGKLLPLQPQYDPTNGLISPGDLILNTGDFE